MLQLDGASFCTGRSHFLDAPAGPQEPSSKLFVTLRLGDLEMIAQLDTGAAWSIITPEVADVLGLFDSGGPKIKIDTRVGSVSGTLECVPVTLVASSGESLDVAATVFVSREWSAGTFIGWNGLLERVRFAVDPLYNHFYFGAG